MIAPAAALSRMTLLVVTDSSATGRRSLEEVVASAMEGGARAVLLREKHLPRVARMALAERLAEMLGAVSGLLLVASDPDIPSDGVHLAAADPFPAHHGGRLVSRSCHSATDVAAAAAEGCAWVTLSPIFPTASKPGYGPTLGTGALAGHRLPVWALGGVGPGNAAACLEAGASGVAVMGAVMSAPDPAAVVAELCEGLEGSRV